MWLVDKRPTTNDALRVPSDEDADEVFLLLDPLFKVWDRGACAKHELFGLSHIQHGRGAAVREELCQP